MAGRAKVRSKKAKTRKLVSKRRKSSTSKVSTPLDRIRTLI